MNQFKEGIRKFYKTYERDRNGRKVYQGSIVSKERKEYLYLGTVSCFVIDENNNVLIERRGKKETEPEELDLVSGHIDNNETPTQAMIREYAEEVHDGNEEEKEKAKKEAIQNLKKLIELDLTFSDNKGKLNKYFIQFYALRTSLKTVTIKKDEVERIEWIPLEEVFEWIRQGKINLQYDKRHEKLFQQVRACCQEKKKEMQEEIV